MIQLHSELIVFITAFFAILFLQSGIDKVVDWKGNYEFHTKQFQNSPLKNYAPGMLIILTVMEISCGFMSLVGVIFFLFKNDPMIPYYACCLASIIFLCLFFGLRMSKDYRGAAAIVPYFILSVIGVFFTS